MYGKKFREPTKCYASLGGGGTPHFKWQGGVRDFGGFEIHDLGISVVLHNHSVI